MSLDDYNKTQWNMRRIVRNSLWNKQLEGRGKDGGKSNSLLGKRRRRAVKEQKEQTYLMMRSKNGVCDFNNWRVRTATEMTTDSNPLKSFFLVSPEFALNIRTF